MFNDWVEVFGKDREAGYVAEDVPDAYTSLDDNDGPIPTADQGAHEQTGFQGNQTSKRKVEMNEEQGENNVTYNIKKDCVVSGSKKKLKSRSDNSKSSMATMFGEFFKCNGERLENIAQSIGYDKDIGTARKQVFEMLGGIDSLSLVDKQGQCMSTVCSAVTWLDLVDFRR
ncbi:hypothetical protein ACS0TY_025965 [Phlomoides rotata]